MKIDSEHGTVTKEGRNLAVGFLSCVALAILVIVAVNQWWWVFYTIGGAALIVGILYSVGAIIDYSQYKGGPRPKRTDSYDW